MGMIENALKSKVNKLIAYKTIQIRTVCLNLCALLLRKYIHLYTKYFQRHSGCNFSSPGRYRKLRDKYIYLYIIYLNGRLI